MQALMKSDPIAVLVCIVTMMLASAGVPERLGFGPQAATALGGIAIALAGVVRILWRQYKLGIAVDWRDVFGAAVGIVAAAVGLEGSAVGNLDPNHIVLVGASLASAFTVQRATEKKGAPPPSVGLLLLFFVACSPDVVHEAREISCTEFALLVAQRESSNGVADPRKFEQFVTSCRADVLMGKDVCVSRDEGRCSAFVSGEIVRRAGAR